MLCELLLLAIEAGTVKEGLEVAASPGGGSELWRWWKALDVVERKL
jgi:hypothetical protein